MKKFILPSSLFISLFSISASAGLPEMMDIYNNPKSAPKVQACKGDMYCNAFTALSKQWQSIPKNYRYHGFNIRRDAQIGDGYGLYKGFYFNQERSIDLVEGGYPVYYNGGSKSKSQEKIFAQGLAVLLYIEDKNGWAK